MSVFNKDFVWGCASSSFQIEGALTEGGRGRSIWDTFVESSGKIWGNCKAEPSCDFYHKYKEDIAIMKDMGVMAYRFSLSWSRILPEGTGRVNREGIEFYNNVINELLKNGIEPYITMYHWDLPEALQEKGGWVNPEIINWFSEYAAVISREFSDRVTNFITLNEPQCFSGISFLHGIHAPGLPLEYKDQFLQVHNMLRAHGAAVRALRANASRKINVGYAPTCGMPYPLTETPEDIEAARQVLFNCPDDMSNWTWQVSWFSDPVFLGHYPEDGLKKYAEYLPEITEEDMKLISEPLDFMGENIYNGYAIKMGPDGKPEYVDREPGYAQTGNDWPMTPDCFRWGLRYLYERYKMPIFITENGTCCRDWVSLDGKVHDPMRIDFINRYMLAMVTAMSEGVDIRGYFVWTLTDNFEWNYGYRDRFGMVYVDYNTGRRIRKDSSYFYEEVIMTNGDNLFNNRELLFFKPEFKQRIWGGSKLRTEFGFKVEGDNIGECWAISAHPNGDCVCESGTYKGKTLSWLWDNEKNLFGNYEGDRFPLLLKIIDAKNDLSIQVHPDDKYAAEHENGSLGKTECWYILDCEENSKLIVGHNAKDSKELNEKLDSHEFEGLFREVPVKKGDFVQIDPGTVHAIKGGIMLLEMQQSSDVTYRVYDYDRLENGVARELHLEKSKDVIVSPAQKDAVISTNCMSKETELVKCKYYTVSKYIIDGKQTIDKNSPFMIVSCVKGRGCVNGTVINRGDNFIVPSGYGKLLFDGQMELIVSEP